MEVPKLKAQLQQQTTVNHEYALELAKLHMELRKAEAAVKELQSAAGVSAPIPAAPADAAAASAPPEASSPGKKHVKAGASSAPAAAKSWQAATVPRVYGFSAPSKPTSPGIASDNWRTAKPAAPATDSPTTAAAPK